MLAKKKIKFIAEQGAIAPMVDMLRSADVRIVSEALDALFAMLCVGVQPNSEDNPYCRLVEEEGGLDLIERLQGNVNDEVLRLKTRCVSPPSTEICVAYGIVKLSSPGHSEGSVKRYS